MEWCLQDQRRKLEPRLEAIAEKLATDVALLEKIHAGHDTTIEAIVRTEMAISESKALLRKLQGIRRYD
jgi:hypothetical protein